MLVIILESKNKFRMFHSGVAPNTFLFSIVQALKRSRKRVRNALHTELPYLISTEFSSNQENESSIANSSDVACADKAVSEAHVARWRSLFVQMDKALQEEGKLLVT